jgi:hypothetical protein
MALRAARTNAQSERIGIAGGMRLHGERLRALSAKMQRLLIVWIYLGELSRRTWHAERPHKV